MRTLHLIWPYIVGGTVWGSSIALLIHGLLIRAWYGYVFLFLFVGCGIMLKVICYRIDKQVEAEFWREFHDRYVE